MNLEEMYYKIAKAIHWTYEQIDEMDMGRFGSFCSEGKAFRAESGTISWAELRRQVKERDAAMKEGT